MEVKSFLPPRGERPKEKRKISRFFTFRGNYGIIQRENCPQGKERDHETEPESPQASPRSACGDPQKAHCFCGVSHPAYCRLIDPCFLHYPRGVRKRLCVPAGAVFIYAAAFYPAELWHRAAQHAGDHHPAVYLRFRDPGGTGVLLYYLPQLGFYSAHHHRLFMRGHRLCDY